MKTLKLAILILLAAAPAQAVPPGFSQVTATAATNMAVFTISGCTNCETKSPAPPLAYFPGNATGTQPSSLGQKTSWDELIGINISNAALPSGMAGGAVTRGLRRLWTSCNQTNTNAYAFKVKAFVNVPTSTTRWSWGHRYHTYTLASNIKLWRLDDGPADFLYSVDASNVYCYNEANNCYNQRWQGSRPPANTSINFWYEYDHGNNTQTGICSGADGYYRNVMNGVQDQIATDMPNGPKGQDDKISVEYTNVSQCPPDGAESYFANLYYDDTFRVVWAWPAASNGTCSNFNINLMPVPQIASGWGGGTISGRINLDKMNIANGLCFAVQNQAREVSSPVKLNMAGCSGAFLNPSFSSVETSSLTVSWPSGGSSYRVILSNVVDFSTILSSGLATSATTTYLGLTANTEYFFKVKVASQSDCTYSSAISTITKSGTPAGCTDMAPSQLSATTGTVTATWNQIVNPATYTVVMSTVANFSVISASGTTQNITTTYFTLAPDTNYFFKVKLSTEGDSCFDSATLRTSSTAPPDSPAPRAFPAHRHQFSWLFHKEIIARKELARLYRPTYRWVGIIQ